MTSNIKQFIKKTNLKIEQEQLKQQSKARGIVVAAYSEIMKRSPVDKGHFKANNILTYNHKASTNTSRLDTRSKEDDSMLPEDETELDSIKWNNGDKIYIQNNLVYSDRLESGTWGIQVQDGSIYKISKEIIKDKIDELKL